MPGQVLFVHVIATEETAHALGKKRKKEQSTCVELLYLRHIRLLVSPAAAAASKPLAEACSGQQPGSFAKVKLCQLTAFA